MQALACQLPAEDRFFQFEFKGQERPRPSSRQAGNKGGPRFRGSVFALLRPSTARRRLAQREGNLLCCPLTQCQWHPESPSLTPSEHRLQGLGPVGSVKLTQKISYHGLLDSRDGRPEYPRLPPVCPTQDGHWLCGLDVAEATDQRFLWACPSHPEPLPPSWHTGNQ